MHLFKPAAVVRSVKNVFRKYRIPKSGYQGSTSGGFSDVPARYAFMFQEYKIEDWEGFNKSASELKDDKYILREELVEADRTYFQSIPHVWKFLDQPSNEDQLGVAFFNHVMAPLNVVRRNPNKWQKLPPPADAPIDNESRREPDFALVNKTRNHEGSSSSSSKTTKGSSSKATKGSSSKAVKGSSSKAEKGGSSRDVDEDLKLEVAIAGEMKRPNLYLGSRLTTHEVKKTITHHNFPDYNPAFPYFQIFSYMIRSYKGVGFLSNYEHTRFFKINATNKIIYMSPAVKFDQVLRESSEIPHTLQTFLFAESLDDQLAEETAQKQLKKQLDNARREADDHEKKEQKEKAEKAAKEEAKKDAAGSSFSISKKSKDTSKSGGKHGKKKEGSSWSIISPATLVLDKCKVIGILGEGLCGVVKECDYEGVKVALKVGLPYDRRLDEEDCFTLVKNEIEIYEKLEELQGKVIPRLVVGGLERFYNPRAMVVVTEKVGMGVEEREERMFVGGKELSREDLVVMKKKGLEGLKKIHESGVVHVDTAVRNTRVDMKDGSVEKVWWIDLNVARIIDYETERAIDKTGHKFDIHYMNLVDSDINRFTSNIDGVIEKMDDE